MGEETYQYISYQKAAEALGCDRSTVSRYVEALGLKPQLFPRDTKKYLSADDFKQIEAAREAAKKGVR